MSQEKLTVDCRPARESDTQEVLELTSNIWEGDDYVPGVWAEWLADPAGQLAVADFEGRVVGLSKLTRLTSMDWWLEGLRVHPEFEGRGIASQLHDYQLEFWLDNGGGPLRLATASFRFPVQRLCERTGFHKAGEFTPFVAPAIAEDVSSFKPLNPGEVSKAIAFTLDKGLLSLSYGLMDLGWRWLAPSEQPLAEAANSGKAWWWREKQGLLVQSEDSGDEEASMVVIQLLACPKRDMVECLLDYRRLATSLGYERAGWAASLHPDLQPILQAAGFERDWDASVFIYEKRHPSTA